MLGNTTYQPLSEVITTVELDAEEHTIRRRTLSRSGVPGFLEIRGAQCHALSVIAELRVMRPLLFRTARYAPFGTTKLHVIYISTFAVRVPFHGPPLQKSMFFGDLYSRNCV